MMPGCRTGSINNTVHGKNAWALSNDPNYLLPLKHDVSAATNGVAVNYDDGADDRLEYISPGAVNATMGLAMTHTNPAWDYRNLESNKGSIFRQGACGDVKLWAGGPWNYGANCGPQCRRMSIQRWSASTSCGAHGCAEPR